jgi:hypothetical protein
MTYIYRAARAHQEELLREAKRCVTEDGVQTTHGNPLLKSTRILSLRLASGLLHNNGGETPTTA